jgi:ribonucleotide monophosphatase NagD (HAD superfamily)
MELFLMVRMPIKILGKPSLEYFSAGITLLDSEPSDITVVGDDWSTDICGATNAGCKSVLLKTGKYKPGDEYNCEPEKAVSNLMDIFK